MIAKITEYGAILVSLEAPNKDGTISDVTRGCDTLDGWLTNTSYFDSTVGRYGNLIARGKFTLDGENYALATNNDPGGIPCAFHGGEVGFDKVFWKVSATVTGKSPPVNIVHHSYWNLSNDQMPLINDHELTLHADQYLPTDIGLIPTGELAPVADTPFDFTKATAIGERVEVENEALKFGGYDHCWVLREGEGIRFAAILLDPKSGRSMEILTDQPGIQFYGGNFLDGQVAGKDGQKYPFRSACCLETQVFPDSPNQKDFPSSILNPGETYTHTMIHKFSW